MSEKGNEQAKYGKEQLENGKGKSKKCGDQNGESKSCGDSVRAEKKGERKKGKSVFKSGMKNC